MNMEYVIKNYVKYVARYGEALGAGNSKVANRNFAIIRKLYTQYKNDERFIAELEKLLSHDNGWVRLDAAYNLIPFFPDKAEKTLEELSQKEPRGNLRFTAEMTLKYWRKGELKF